MAAYLIRRLLLVIPTLWAIITINFFIVQIAPGGPVDQAIAAIELGHGSGFGSGGVGEGLVRPDGHRGWRRPISRFARPGSGGDRRDH